MSATLQGLVRDKLGSRSSRVLRLQDRIPASVQGEGKPNVNFSIGRVEFEAARRHHEHLFDIELDQGGTETGMVHELQWSALGQEILHVEFARVVRGRKTEVEVPLTFVGHPKGGVLNALLDEIMISCLPSEIPDAIEVLVNDLEHGHPLLASDLKLPEGTELAVPGKTQVAVVVAAQEEVEAVEEETEDEVAPVAAPKEDED